MVFNTSSAEILDRWLDHNRHQALFRQIAYASLGSLVAIFVYRAGFLHILKFSPLLLATITLLLILVFVPGIGKMRNGSHRWIGLTHFTVQPSEIAKYLVPMVYVEWAACQEGKKISFFHFCRILGLLAIPLFLVMVEPDNGTAAVTGASLIPLFFITHIRIKFWLLPVCLLIAIGSVAAFNLPYVRGRIEVYLHPENDIKGRGHQPYQAKIAAGSGNLFGKGPGGSLQKMTYLPEAQNDYIAAIYAEEFGFIGILFLIILYMLFAAGGFAIAMRSTSSRGCYLATGITFLIALQAFLNLGVVSGLLPTTGVNLPFFSQGGTSLVANIIGLTILLDVGRDEKKSCVERRGNGRPSLPRPSRRRNA